MKSTNVCVLLFAVSGISLSPVLAQVPDDNGGVDHNSGVTALSAPADRVAQRYLVTYVKSRIDAPRSATVVTVTNLANQACSVKIDWFTGFSPNTPACTTLAVVGSGVSHDFCSREVLSNITTCNSTCDPELLFTEGKAIVSSSAIPGCGHMGVEARVYYTKGETSDTDVSAVSNSNIVRVPLGNEGD